MQSASSLHSLSSCTPILLVRHYIQDCHVQRVTVHAGVLLSDATALSSPRSPDVVLGERVLRMLISCPECHTIPLTRSVFVFGTIEDTPNIIQTGCNTDTWNTQTLGTLLQRSTLQPGIRVDNKRKRKRPDSVLWQKPLHPQKNQRFRGVRKSSTRPSQNSNEIIMTLESTVLSYQFEYNYTRSLFHFP